MQHQLGFPFKAVLGLALGLAALSPAQAMSDAASTLPETKTIETPLPAVAEAEELETGLSFSFDVVSDYRFRGVSLSDRKPAVQAGVEYQHDSGLFVGTWASTIAEYSGAEQEVDLYVGYARAVGPFDVRTMVAQYVYPGGKDVNYLEVSAEVGAAIGPAEVALEAAFIPDQRNTDGTNFYAGLDASYPLPIQGFSVHGHVGREAGAFGRKLDWAFGVSHTRGPVTLKAVYGGSDFGGESEAGRAGKPGVLLSAGVGF
jgi:uncharacterized protein (TIGR02001 family)